MSDLDIFNKDDQQFLLDAGRPVLLVGPHGVGKTSVLRSLATNFNLKMHELNAATLDPFVHIVGIPVNHEGKVTMTPPEELQDAELLFVDEINRADRPTRNALFELICDHSVNGKKLEKLKLVVAAMNPPEEGYQVDALDEAMDDRFLYRFSVKRNIDFALNLITDEHRKQAVSKWYSALDSPPSPRRLTWVVETAMGETINEAALLNALDDTRYGSKALLRMLSVTDHGPDAVEEDPLISDDEKLLTAKILASTFINHSPELSTTILDRLEKYRACEWMPDPSDAMEMTTIKEVYASSEYIKDLESLLEVNVKFVLSIPSHNQGWVGEFIDKARAL